MTTTIRFSCFIMRHFNLISKSVKPAFTGLLALIALPLLTALAPRYVASSVICCHAAEKRVYLSKDYVDSVVHQEFVSLNTAMNIPGADFKQKMAIEESRRIVQRLKAQAKGDPNSQYVLFRAGELEQQLVLEENDILLQKSRDLQKQKNAAIDTFNLELGKKRPDFSNLSRLVARMDVLNDQNKSGEMRRSLAQRKTNVSRELMYRFEKILMNGDKDTVRVEFDYCSRNRTYLSIPDASFEKIAQRIKLQAEAIRKKPGIEAALRRGRECMGKNQIRDAWLSFNSARFALDQSQGNLPLADWNPLSGQARSLLAALNGKEDSLVNVVVSLYQAKGEDPALLFIEKTLKKIGVSETKVAAASMYVLSHGAQLPKRDSLINREIDALSSGRVAGEINIDDIRERAKQKAKAKADSIRAAEEAKTGMLVLEIYSLLERGRAEDAFVKFNGNLAPLQTYLFPEALQALSTAVAQAYQAQRDGKNDIPQMVAAVTPSTTADDLKTDQEKATNHITKIYAMLEQGKADEAFRHFSKIRDKLKQHVSNEVFTMVETTVTQAYNSHK
jgi:hypothetical protein